MSDVVVDASVWVSRLVAGDAHHARSQGWFSAQGATGHRLIAPALVLAEVAGAIRRRTGQPRLAAAAINLIQRLPTLRLVPIDADLALSAAELSGEHGMRGADALYVATALQLGVPLVTLDREQRLRASAVIVVETP
jgi:predicted nucleic acid-binding protein